MMNPKKMRKLLRDPKLFFKDMLHKRLPRKSNTVPTLVKKKGNYSYSVVAAVYGVEKYLDDFFKSLVNQSLDFKSHIQLIMVDDGSLDNSAEIIKKWQKKYPDNIVYLKKENGGQASARNLGMEYASGEWISFIDPDDFVDVEYFFEVDKHIYRQRKELIFVSCNFIFFYEDKNQISDTHPLNYRFRKESVIEVADDNVFHQLTVNSAFFRSSALRDSAIRFHEDIKPNFEDGDFVSRLLLEMKGSFISYLPSAKYFYRKRSDGTSTLDNSFLDERRYTQLIENGYLRLLKKCYESNGVVPKWLQSTILYDLVWIIKSLLSNGHKLIFMTDDFRNSYIDNLKKIASFIDDETILQYTLAGCWFFHKVGILGFLKNSSPNFSIAYVESLEVDSGLLGFRYFWYGDLPLEVISIDGKEVFPIYAKNRSHDFLGSEFVCERMIWIPVKNNSSDFSVSLNGVVSRISIKGKQYSSGVKCSQIFNFMQSTSFDAKKINPLAKPLRHFASLPVNRSRYKNAWVFMDRDTMADDNAEHLYRFVINNHPDINAFFVLRNSSPDWERLNKEGFKLLNFDSQEHYSALLNADFLLSSHADGYVVNPLPKKDYADILKYKFVFLQHGVTHNNLSRWLNSKPIEMLVAATRDEFESLAADNNSYKFCKKQVVLTGFPRHDNLLSLRLNHIKADRKKIVIMPTWRNNLMGEYAGIGNKRSLNAQFFQSNYAIAWKNFLTSVELKEISEKFNADVVFYPHANIDIYIDGFDVPDYISVRRISDGKSIQMTFVETDLLITDYSSVAFEVAYLKKPVIYYQFDRDEVFSGNHTFEKGYFDYFDNGFGPVCLDSSKVFEYLNSYFENASGDVWSFYEKIAEETFEFRDGKCCERTFEAVKRLGEIPVQKENEIIKNLHQGAWDAAQKGFCQIAINRYQQCVDLTENEEDFSVLISILSKNRQYEKVIKNYEKYGLQWKAETVAKCLDAFVALGCNAYVKKIIDYNSDAGDFSEFSESLLKYAAAQENSSLFSHFLQKNQSTNQLSIDILSRYLKRDWEGVRAVMRFSSDEILLSHFDLFLQACFRTNCIEYAEQVFKEISDQIEPAMANVYAVRIKLA